jgi:peptidoglycan/LPS O-acetylase OafA/YrhL
MAAHTLPSAARIANEKYPALTGVRAVGATVVFFDHFPLASGVHITVNVMAFFFALSGFLIVRIYYERLELNSQWLKQYFVNRFARIYPVYFLLLSVAVCIQHDFRPWVLFTNYTLTHALFHRAVIIIQPSWSLTVEECFYLLAPVFMVLARRYNFFAAFALGCMLSVAALAISTTGNAFLGTKGFVLSTTFFGHFVEFFAGVYLALELVKLERSQSIALPGCKFTIIGLIGVSALVIAMIVVYAHLPLNTLAVIWLNNLLIPVPIAVLYWGLIREKTLLSRFLSNGVIGLLGRASYSFYLLHTIIIDYVSAPMLPTFGHRPLVVMLTLVVTWLLSIALFVWYEEPLNKILRRRFGQHLTPRPTMRLGSGLT